MYTETNTGFNFAYLISAPTNCDQLMISALKNPKNYVWLILLAYTCVIGWTIAFNGLVGMSWDESFLLFNASNLAQDTLNGMGSVFSPARWMSYNYGGATKELMLMPFAMAALPTPDLMRLAWAIYGLVSLLCMFFVLKKIFSPQSALLTVLFLCLDATFIKATMLAGRREEMIMVFYLWTSLFCLSQFPKKQKHGWLFAACLLMGVGFWTKIMFAGYLLGFVAVGLCFWKKSIPMLKNKKTMLVAISGFVLGCLPFWISNFSTGMPTFKIIFNALTDQNAFDTNNTNLLANLIDRFKDLYLLISYKAQMGFDPFENKTDIAWLLLCGFSLFPFCFNTRYPRKKLATLALFYLPIIPGSIFVMQYRLIGHLLMLYPLPHIFCGVFACWCLQRRGKLILKTAICLLILVHTAHQQTIMFHMRSLVKNMNMHRSFTPAVRQAFDFMGKNNIRSVLCVINWEYFEQSLQEGKNNGLKTISPGMLYYNYQIVEPPLPEITKKDIETLIIENFANTPAFYMLLAKDSHLGPIAESEVKKQGREMEQIKSFRITNINGELVLYKITTRKNA